jgi:Na+-driven multidrug efflux pump
MLSGSGFVHVCLIYLFVTVLDWGFEGVCFVTALHFVVRWLISFVLINCLDKLKNKYPEEVKLFSKETVTNWGNQFNLCLGSLFMGFWGWIAFDIFTLISSYLSSIIISA